MMLFKNIKIQKQRGFTIVELLVYMGLVSILLVFLSQIFTSLVELRLESEASASVEQDSRYILTRLAYDIHRADSVDTPNVLGSTSSSLELTIGGVEYIYALQGTDLTLSAPAAVQVNGYDTEISSLSFRKLGSDTGTHVVQATYTVTSKTMEAGGPEVKTVTTSIGLR